MDKQIAENGDNPVRRASYPLIAEWCIKAWKELDREVIIKSFKYANLGKDYNTEELHSKLLDILTNKSVNEEVDHIGLPDSEDDTDKIETLLIEEVSNQPSSQY